MEEQGAVPPAKPAVRRETIQEQTLRTLDELAQQGFFDNLPGSGRPLDLSDEDNPFIPQDMRLAYRILRNAGYSLPWIELRNDVEADITNLQRRARSHRAHVSSTIDRIPRIPTRLRRGRWEALKARHLQFLTEYADQIDAVNRKIDDFNLSVPVISLQLNRVNSRRELEEVASCLPPECPWTV